MATIADDRLDLPSLADVLDRLGDVPPGRVCARPAPGSATEADVLAIHGRTKRLYELIDGVLVEKPMGYEESILAALIITFLNQFVLPRRLGLVSAPDGMMRLAPGLVLIPDVAFCSWDRFPGGKVAHTPLPDLVPDLAVEVLSKTNTRREMARKRRHYFGAGTRLVWEVDPVKRSVRVYTTAEDSVDLSEADTLDGGDVLPGFALPLAELFANLGGPETT